MQSASLPTADDAAALRALRVIPGVGRSVAGDLLRLGIRRVEDLRGQDPEDLYERLCAVQGVRVDLCMRYTFRCAVYFATREAPDPALLRWWAWKGLRLAPDGTPVPER